MKLESVVMLFLLTLNLPLSAFDVKPARVAGTIYIHADGSIEPTGAPITTSDNLTYLLTDNTFDSIIVERSNIIFHGNNYTIQGSGDGTGIDLNNVTNVIIEDTCITDFQVGVHLCNSILPNSLLNNYFLYNQYSILLELSCNSIISGNKLMNCHSSTGILLCDSADNTISENDIMTNYIGVQIEGSSNNKVHHNNFIDNTYQAYVANSSSNLWDDGYPTCGNFWSDYDGTDSKNGPSQNITGSDGVGDLPYTIDADNSDHYPLMYPWTSNFTVPGYMTVGYRTSPLTLDPARAYDTSSFEIVQNVYETLVSFDEEKTDQFVPCLATDWSVSTDGLTYTFNIRQNVRFHNNQLLTTEDVEYSLERIIVIEGGEAWTLYEPFFNLFGSRDSHGNLNITGEQIDNAITRNGTSVTLHLTKPYPPLLQILSQGWSSILCKSWCIAIGDWPGTWDGWTTYNRPTSTAIENQTAPPPGPHTNAMCGTGPFILDYCQTGTEWSIVKFDGYWGGWPAPGSAGFLRRVTAKIVPDWETRRDMFLEGKLDHIQVPRTSVSEVLGQPGVRCDYPLEQLSCYAMLFTFNLSTSSPYLGVPGGLPRGTFNESGIPPDFLSDTNVRKGFAYAFDYTRLINEGLSGEAYQPATPIIPGISFHNPAQKKYNLNLTEAARCFAAAWGGQLVTNGFKFTICYRAGAAVEQKTCEIIKANVESLNPRFHVQIQSMQVYDYFQSASNHELPIFQYGWLADFADPHNFVYAYIYSGGPFPQYQAYSNTTLDMLTLEGIATTNETARRLVYNEIQSLYYEDCPSVPLYQPVVRRFERTWVQGWYYNPLQSLENNFYVQWKGTTTSSSRYSWPTFRGDVEHSGFTQSPGPSTNSLQWNFSAGDEIDSSPAVADGKVYFGSSDHKVYCLDASTGAQQWTYTTGSLIISSPAVANGNVYVSSEDGRLYCLDALTGTQIWNYTAGPAIYSSPAVSEDKLYFGSSDGIIYCLNAYSGAHMWHCAAGTSIFSSPAVAIGKVYVGTEDGYLFCLDASTGALCWGYHVLGNYTNVHSSPAVVDGRVYFGCYDGRVFCHDALTGAQLWSTATGNRITSSPAVAYGKVYVGSDDDRLFCLDALNGTQLWSYTIGGSEVSSPAVAEGKVYFGGYDKQVHCLNASTGALIWNYTTPGYIFASPAIVDNMLFIGGGGGGDHVLYAFGNIIRVPQDYQTIQAAINAAPPGATIIISPGVYNESIIVNKPLTIIGITGSSPIFGGGGSGIAITLLSSASGSTIAGIVITNWDQGILVQGCSGCKIYDNIMSQMNLNGITLQGASATNNLIYSNIFEQDGAAINLTASSAGNTICQNIISFSSIGLDMECSGNTVYENIIAENIVGLKIATSNNKLYHNNFLENNAPFSVSASIMNVWDNGYPSGGNYWSNHDNTDGLNGQHQDLLGSDGIADKPYTIASNNVDNYPLAQPFAIHNIGIISFIQSKTVIGQPVQLHINLYVGNLGMFNETFAMTLRYNTTFITDQIVILNTRNSTIFNFTLDTATLAKGNYTLVSTVGPVQSESNTADNIIISWVVVTIPGDVDGNLKVDMGDVVALCKTFGATPGKPRWDPNCDIDDNGKIDMGDIITACKNFGQHYP